MADVIDGRSPFWCPSAPELRPQPIPLEGYVYAESLWNEVSHAATYGLPLGGGCPEAADAYPAGRITKARRPTVHPTFHRYTTPDDQLDHVEADLVRLVRSDADARPMIREQ